MPNFIPVKKVKRSKYTKDDIKIGDVWKVNFPSSYKGHIMKNGDSKYCTYHPCLVIGINDDERCIEVVEITHRKSDHKEVIEGTDLEVEYKTVARLKPNHFRVKIDNIEPTSERYMKIIKKIEEAKDDGALDILTQEQTILEYMIQEAKKMTVKGKVPVCKDFKEFCSKISDASMSMKWFIKNNIQWPKGEANKYPFHWPDDLIRDKIGNCFDQSIFMHYFLKKKRVPHKLFLISWVGDSGNATGHILPVYEKKGYVWIWLYLYPGYGLIGGPFRDYDDAKKTLDQFFLVSVNKALGSPSTPYSSYLDEEDTSKFDNYYGNTDITQEDYIMMNHGYNLKSSHMFRINIAGHSIYNPIFDLLRTIDVLKELYRLFKTQDKVEECYLLEDDELETVE